MAGPFTLSRTAGERGRRASGDRVRVRRYIPRPGDVEHHQFRADRALFAGLAVDHDDGAADRSRQFDRGLIGQDIDERVLLADLLPDRDMPGDDLGLGRALADIGQSDDVPPHFVVWTAALFVMAGLE